MATIMPPKDPNSVEPYHVVWCSENGVNTGAAIDTGELQGATISSYTVTVVTSGITKDSDNKAAVTIHGVSYAINTVVTVWLSGGTAETDYDILCRIITSDGRTLDKTMTIPVRTA